MIKKSLTVLSCLFLGWNTQAQTFTEDFTPLNTWTQISSGISITTSQAKYNACADATSRRIYTSHGLTLSDNWVVDIDFQFTATGTGGPGHHLVSLTDGNLDPVSSNTYVATNQDAIAMMFYSTNHTNTASTFELVGTSKNDNNAWVNSTGIVLAASKTYYLRLERLDATHARISAFSDAARTTHVTGSPQCFTLSSGITNNLSVIQHGNTCWGASDRSLTGWIDNTKLTNYSTTETIAGNQQVCSGTGNPVAFTSSATSNNPDATYQWQLSTDGGTTWTNISGATSATYDAPSGITVNTLYRRVTSHASACSDQHISNSVSVTVVDCNSLSCDFSEDFTPLNTWTTVGSGVGISGGTFNYTTCAGAASNRMYTTHGVTLTNSWRLDFDFNFSAVGSGGPGHHLASMTDGTQDPVSANSPWTTPTNQDAVAAMFYSTNHTNTASTFMLVGCSKNDNNAWSLSSGILLTQGVQYYISLERLDQTHGRISVYSDAARTVHVTNSPQCFSIDPNVTANLSVLQHGNTSWAGSDRSLTGTIDNDCLSLMTFSAGTISKDQKVPCGTIPTSILNSTAASGPNSYYTFTYQWQQSTDNVTWTNIPSATSLSYSPPVLYVTTYFRRVATGPCGMTLISNTVVRSVTLNAALNSAFSLTADCQSGQTNFTVTATPVVSTGTGFHSTWTITDLTAGGSPTTGWPNCAPCSFTGYPFVQGHTYQIVYTVKDTCTQEGSTTHTVTCSAGMAQQDGSEISGKADSNYSLIHPNPTNGVFTVDVKGLNAKSIAIYNTLGVLVQTVSVSGRATTSKFDLSDQPSGMYLIHIHTEDGMITHKLIKE